MVWCREHSQHDSVLSTTLGEDLVISSDDTANALPGAAQRPTLRDVAREADLSVTQTSRALNGHSDVAEATKQRAMEAAGRIGYMPNLEARRLKKPDSRSHSVGLILDTGSQRFSDPFVGELLTALVDEAAANRYELQLSAPLPDEDPVASYERTIRANRVDGFVLLKTAMDDARVKYLAGRGTPFVTFGESAHADDYPSVTDSDDCLRPAIDHLVGLGHRRIACVAEPLTYALAATRHTSFLRALEANGIEANPEYIVIKGHREDAGAAAAAHLLDLDQPPTAIVAFHDLLAIGVIAAAQARGVTVPSELSVVGFDDIYAARHMSPPLTTLRQTPKSIGRSLIRQLLAAMDNPADVEHVYLTPELIVRQSTGPAPAH